MALDQYADTATGLLALLSALVQLLAGTPGAAVLAALALVLPAGLLTYLVNRFCKLVLPKQRRNRDYHDLVSPWLRGSFPSFHTQFAATFGATFVTAIALLSPAEVRNLATALAILTMGLSVALVAWSRLYLDVHDRVDVYGGLALGVGVGWAVGFLFTARNWVPSGPAAWAMCLVLAMLVLVVSLWERRKRSRPASKQ